MLQPSFFGVVAIAGTLLDVGNFRLLRSDETTANYAFAFRTQFLEAGCKLEDWLRFPSAASSSIVRLNDKRKKCAPIWLRAAGRADWKTPPRASRGQLDESGQSFGRRFRDEF